MTTIPDIIKAIKALWDADGTLGAITLQHGRVETAPDAPYATIVCRPAGKEYNAGYVSIEDYQVVIRIYGGPLLSDAAGYELAMGLVLDTPSNISGMTGFVSIFRDSDSVDEDPFRLTAQDVLISQGAWTVKVLNNRAS